MKIRFAIGIDPGVNTGLCAWSLNAKKIVFIKSLFIHEAMEQVRAWHEQYPGEIKVRFEDARLRKWIPRQKNEVAERGLREGAGSVKRDCGIWEDFLTAYKIPFEKVAPKDNRTKMKADRFKVITGYNVQTNEHARDAAMLVIGS